MDRSNALVAVICIPVSFFVGVLFARVFPTFAVESGNAAEWIAALATAVTAGIAALALTSWRTQLREATRHAAAAEIAETVELLELNFYEARSPMYLASEFPPTYYEIDRRERTSVDEAAGWQHVYAARYGQLWPHILKLATLRAKARALLSEECVMAMEALARKARELDNYFSHKVDQIRKGPEIVATWSDQRWVKLVNDSVWVIRSNATDAYSLEFERVLREARRSINVFIQR